MRPHDTHSDTTIAILNGESTTLQPGITPSSVVPPGFLCLLTLRVIDRANLGEMVKLFMLLSTVAYLPGDDAERPDDIGPTHLRAVVKRITENPETHVSVLHMYGLFAEDVIEALQQSGNIFDFPATPAQLDTLENWAESTESEEGGHLLPQLLQVYSYIVRGKSGDVPAWAAQNPRQFCSVLRTEAHQPNIPNITADRLRHAAFILNVPAIFDVLWDICKPPFSE